MISKIKFKKWILIFGIIIISLNHNLTVRNYIITSDKINKEDLNIILIADLHSTIYKNNQKQLIDMVTSQKPDLILLAGDIADDIVPILGTKLFLDGVKDIAPMYYVKGNHEYWSKNTDYIDDVFKSYGVNILSDNYIQTSVKDIKLIIAGVEDPDRTIYKDKNYDQSKSMEDAFKNLPDGYKILLAHRPEKIEEYLKYPFDLVVSGHAHGGQARIPFIMNGLIAPHQGLFPKYAGGVYKHDNLSHVVSRGLSVNPKLPRIFNPPEIVVIKIKPNI